MEIRAIDKIKFHLKNLKENDRVGQGKLLNQLDVECIEKVINACNGDLSKIIDTEKVFKRE